VTRSVVCAGAVLAAVIGAAAERQDRQPTDGALPGVRVEPPATLHATGLYTDGRVGAIDPRNRAFTPQYPLWTDGLQKRRWVYLPPDAAIDVTDAHAWDYPVGTRFWKEFSLGSRPVETRLLWKASAAGWVFATYVWNADGTDAVLAPDGGVRNVVDVAPGRRHSIPSKTDCMACHGPRSTGPLGFNALQLSTDRDPNAIHGERPRPDMLTLHTLEQEGRLSPSRPDLVSQPPRIRTADPATRAVLGYLAANCGVCHDGSGDITGFGPSVAYREVMTDGDAVARALADHPTRWQIPGLPEGSSVLLRPGAPDQSAIVVRMRSRSPSSQMPALGTVVRDDAAVDAVAQWTAHQR
jgi:hypothetical protein